MPGSDPAADAVRGTARLKLAVAGGTGTVGRLVADAARDAGHDVAVLARTVPRVSDRPEAR